MRTYVRRTSKFQTCPRDIPASNYDHFLVPQKISKKRLFVKNGAPRIAFLSISVANSKFLDFLFVFCCFFHEKNNVILDACCSQQRPFFSKLVTLTKHRILQVWSHFFICLLDFFFENGEKMSLKLNAEKNY